MKTVPELFISAVNKFSSSDAVMEGGKRVSYEELGRLVNKFSSYLTSLGIKKGDKVITLLPNSIEFVVSFFGIAQLGPRGERRNIFQYVPNRFNPQRQYGSYRSRARQSG